MLTKVIQTTKSNYIKNYIKNLRNLRIIGSLASAILLLLMTLTVRPIVLKGNIAEAAPGTATASTTTLTMATNFESANLNLVVKSSDGTFASSSENELAKFGVTTNNYTGYTLSISAKDDNGLLSNSTSGTSFKSIDSILDAYSFANGSGELYNGKWGYFPSKYDSDVNNYFRPSPTTSASTLDVTSSANNETNNYTIGLGARADYTTPSGTYTNTFILSTVGNPAAYTIIYSDNSGDFSVSNLPEATTGKTTDTKIKLTSDVPTRTNYTFKGWCSTATTSTSDGGTECPSSATTYASGSDFGIDQTTTNITTLYAIWELSALDITIKTANGIESVTLNGVTCTSADGCVVEKLTVGQSYTLSATLSTGYKFVSWDAGSYGTIASPTSISTRYTVGLGESTITPSASNKYTITIKTTTGISSVSLNGVSCASTSGCAVENLEYGQSYTLTATKSSGYNVTWNPGNYGTISDLNHTSTSGKYTVGAGNSTIIPTTVSCTTTISGTMQTYSEPANLCTDATGSLTDNRDDQVYTVARYNDLIWMTRNLAIGCSGSSTSYGDSRTTRSLTSSNSNVSSTWSTSNAYDLAGRTYSYIEPQMQCSSTYGAWYNYAAATAGTIANDTSTTDTSKAKYSVCPYGWRLFTNAERITTTEFKDIFNPVTGGRYANGSIRAPGSGYWWSSTAVGTLYRYYLYYGGSSLSAANDDRYGGLYVRCVKKISTVSDATYMQDVTAAMVSNTANLATATLTDNRDNQQYSVVKYGNLLWMTRNLAIGCSGSGSTYGSDRVTRSLTSSNSNVSTTWSTSSASALSGASSSTQVTDLATPRMQCSSDYGAWYNYAAATAGTIATYGNNDDAQYSICPHDWRLFTYLESNTNITTEFITSFYPVTGGSYEDGSILYPNVGGWWSSTSANVTDRRGLHYSENSDLLKNFVGNRRMGYYVRCVKSAS